MVNKLSYWFFINNIIIRQYVTSILFYVVGIDNVFLGVRNANNEIPYSVGTLKKIEEPVML